MCVHGRYAPNTVLVKGSRDGAVVRALAFHQCGPGSIPGLDVICGLSLLLVLFSAPRGLRVLRFSPLRKNQHFQIPIRSGMLERLIHEPLAREIGQPLLTLSSLNKINLVLRLGTRVDKYSQTNFYKENGCP